VDGEMLRASHGRPGWSAEAPGSRAPDPDVLGV